MLSLGAIIVIAAICASTVVLSTGFVIIWLKHRYLCRRALIGGYPIDAEAPAPPQELAHEEDFAAQFNDNGQPSNSRENLVRTQGLSDADPPPQVPEKWWYKSSLGPKILRNVISKFSQRFQSDTSNRHSLFNSSRLRDETILTNNPVAGPHSLSNSREKKPNVPFEESTVELPPAELTAKSNSGKGRFAANARSKKRRPISAPLPLAPRVEHLSSAAIQGSYNLTPNPSHAPVWDSGIPNEKARAMPRQQISPSSISYRPGRFYHPFRDAKLPSAGLAAADSVIQNDEAVKTSSSIRCDSFTHSLSISTHNIRGTVRHEGNQADFAALSPPRADSVTSRLNGPRSALPPYAVSNAHRSNVNAPDRLQVNPLQLHPVHEAHTPNHERQHGAAMMHKGFNTNTQEKPSTPTRTTPLRTPESTSRAGAASSPGTRDRAYRRGHRRQNSVRLPLVPAGILRAASFSNPIKDADDSDSQDEHGFENGITHSANHEKDADDVFNTDTKESSLPSWNFPAMKPENNEPYQHRQRRESGGLMMPRRRGLNSRTLRGRTGHSYRCPDLETIWEEEDEGMPDSPVQSPVAARDVAHGRLERGDRSLDDTSATGGTRVERDSRGAETPSVRIVQDSEEQDSDSAMMTPTGKTAGRSLGKRESRPGSLYDKDGFLKE